jgi:hypothetical protein
MNTGSIFITGSRLMEEVQLLNTRATDESDQDPADLLICWCSGVDASRVDEVKLSPSGTETRMKDELHYLSDKATLHDRKMNMTESVLKLAFSNKRFEYSRILRYRSMVFERTLNKWIAKPTMPNKPHLDLTIQIATELNLQPEQQSCVSLPSSFSLSLPVRPLLPA